MPIVYIATNSINGHRYIGATKHDIPHRRRKHFSDAKAKRPYCRVFNAAIRKYGETSFVWEVVFRSVSIDDVMREEIRLIAEMKPEYNITAGGRGLIGLPRTKEWLEKMSIAARGKKLSPAHRASNAVRLQVLREKRHRSVVCLNDGKFYASCKDAAEAYGITHSNIRSVAEGGQATTKGGLSFHFSKAPMSREECDSRIQWLLTRKEKQIRRSQEGRRKPVLCVSDGTSYPDVKSAGAAYGLKPGTVGALCRGGGRSVSGFSFTFVGQSPVVKRGMSAEGRKKQNEARLRGVLKNSKRVICLDDNVVYESISDAARAIGRCVESVSASIRRNGRTGGKAFRFVE